MKVLTTVDTPQQLSIIPRSYPSLATVRLRNESTNGVDTILNVPCTTSNGYLTLSPTFNLLEGFTYELTILSGSSVIYKDKVFCTDQTISEYSVNVDTITWDQTNYVWNTTEINWEDVSFDDIYETEDTYDNDYIIL